MDNVGFNMGKWYRLASIMVNQFYFAFQVYKATADYDSAYAMYQMKYSQMVNNESVKFSDWRSIVLDRKLPRKTFVQVNTSIQG